jgi:hypothetical protein
MAEPVSLPDGSFISKLTVTSVRTLSDTSPQDYVHVKDNYVRLITGDGTSYDVKMSIHLEGTGGGTGAGFNGYPVIQMGAGGTGSVAEVGKITKDTVAWKFDYLDAGGNTKRIWMNASGTEGILIESVSSSIRMTTNNKLRFEVTPNGDSLEIVPDNIRLGNLNNMIEILPNSIKIAVDASNYIEITPSGVKVVGTRIDLN